MVKYSANFCVSFFVVTITWQMAVDDFTHRVLPAVSIEAAKWQKRAWLDRSVLAHIPIFMLPTPGVQTIRQRILVDCPTGLGRGEVIRPSPHEMRHGGRDGIVGPQPEKVWPVLRLRRNITNRVVLKRRQIVAPGGNPTFGRGGILKDQHVNVGVYFRE